MSSGGRIATVVLALGAASALAIAGVGLPWWSMTDVSIGPTYSARCFGGDCERIALDWVGDPSWSRFGVATWGAGLIAAACAVVLAASVASRRTGRLAAKMSITSAMCATGAGAAFVGTFPGDSGMTSGMRHDLGGYLYFAGVLLAVVAAVVALRSARAAVPA
jgi:hypothetical protein